MQKKTRTLFGVKLPGRFKFVRLILFLVIIAFCVNAYISIKMLRGETRFVSGDLPYLALQLNFGAVVSVLLITLTYILHRGFGALSRMESILEEVTKGNLTLRIHLRKEDFLRPFVDKLNKVLDLLEKNSKP